ncbi:MAG: hypothetical protein P1V81_17310, partial [Planctomycetota bacterium]|nr:hypothetical protein [Planctomycetota bacterium]
MSLSPLRAQLATALMAAALVLVGVSSSVARPLCPQEGPLANDAFQPTDLPAEEAFVTGRRLVAEARSLATAGDPSASTRLSQGFESWRQALAASESGAGLRLDPTDPDGRLVVGIEEAVRLELDALDPTELGQWIARFEDLASAAFVDGSGEQRVERTFPGTAAATRAALRLADAALEAG